MKSDRPAYQLLLTGNYELERQVHQPLLVSNYEIGQTGSSASVCGEVYVMRSDRPVHQLLLVSVYQMGQTSSAVSVQPGLHRVSVLVACL